MSNPSSGRSSTTPTHHPPSDTRRTSSNDKRSLHPGNYPSSTSTPSTNTSSANLVSQLRDFFPLSKHATFHVKLVIHQLHSVPFISGDFRIKWKFKDLQAVDKHGKPMGFGKTLARKLDPNNHEKKKRSTGDTLGSTKGKGKEKAYNETPPGSPSIERAILPDAREALTNSPTRLRFDSVETTPWDTPDHTPDATSSEPILSRLVSPQPRPPTKPLLQPSVSSDPTAGDIIGVDFRTETRGYTEFHPLEHFKVNFEKEIDAAVQMTIEKETGKLMTSELKLTVLQLVVPGDPAAPPTPRLGHVLINLAEYANVGPVTRNYLLRRSKVNALLRMTITVTQISGETNYTAPPLRKEEIKAGISEYLNGSEFRLPLYSEQQPLDDPWLSNNLDLIIPPTPPEDESPPPTIPLPAQLEQVSRSESGNKRKWRTGKKAATLPVEHPSPPRHPKPRAKKPLHPTELLIEAIFNPYPSTEDRPSPFSYYVPHMPVPEPMDSSRSGSGMGTSDTTSLSMGQEGDESVESMGMNGGGISATEMGENSNGNLKGRKESGGSRWWKRKQTSRPVTPASSRSTGK